MSTISNNDIARAIYLVLKDPNLEALSPSGGHNSKYEKVVQFLSRRRLLPKSSDILARLDKIINTEEDKVVAKIYSAKKISETIHKELIQKLGHRYGAKKITLTEYLDPKLLGGLKIEVDDEVIDLTIRNKIGKLQEYLIGNAR